MYELGVWAANVTDDHGIDWIVESEDGWSSSPPVRPTREDKTSADGAWSGPGFYGARVIALSGRALAEDRMSMLAAKDRMKAAVQPRQPMALTVTEAHMARTAQVRLSETVEISDRGARSFTWSLVLAASDPRRYSAAIISLSTDLPTFGSSGRTYPRTHPFVYGGASEGGSGSVYITQEGDYDETPAVITFTGPITSPQVAHVQSGRALTFAITLLSTDTLVVDLAARTAMLNGYSGRTNTITTASAWFMLAPGVNELQFRGQQDAGPATPLMTVTAQSAWT